MNAIVIKSSKGIKKADIARDVFNDCYKNGIDKAPQRKDIIARLKSEAGLTDAGAATYLQNMKKQAGITNMKKSVSTAAVGSSAPTA